MNGDNIKVTIIIQEGEKMKKLFATISCIALMFTANACSLFQQDEVFTGSGITITLTSAFTEKETVTVPLYLESMDHIFMGMRESKSSINGIGVYTLSDYIDAVLDANGKTADTISYDQDDVTFYYAYYSSTVDSIEYGYMMVCMVGESYFYTMNFGCLNKNLEDNKEQYLDWAKTITVE